MSIAQSAQEPAQLIPYKQVKEESLDLHVFYPENYNPDQMHTGIVIFHGGGWAAGEPESVYGFARRYAEMGYVAICVEYRLYRDKTVSVSTCVEDARSALRFVRLHANELGVSSNHIVALGYSAGGHLAIATAVFDRFDDPEEDITISCRPNAIVLYSAVLDTSVNGYGYVRVEKQWKELSPRHNIHSGLPPIVIFHGTEDQTVPYRSVQQFEAEAQEQGNECVLITLEGEGHNTLLNDKDVMNFVMESTAGFLSQHRFTPVISQ